MNYLLDTNVISEPMKPEPNAGLMLWLAQADEDRTRISVVTIAEIRDGIERLAPGKKQVRLDRWLDEELIQRFSERILPIDTEIADACGRLVARGQKIGRPIDLHDAYIAATAGVRDLTLVTRNVPDFRALVDRIENPWT